jgi:hypothetical protein
MAKTVAEERHRPGDEWSAADELYYVETFGENAEAMFHAEARRPVFQRGQEGAVRPKEPPDPLGEWFYLYRTYRWWERVNHMYRGTGIYYDPRTTPKTGLYMYRPVMERGKPLVAWRVGRPTNVEAGKPNPLSDAERKRRSRARQKLKAAA